MYIINTDANFILLSFLIHHGFLVYFNVQLKGIMAVLYGEETPKSRDSHRLNITLFCLFFPSIQVGSGSVQGVQLMSKHHGSVPLGKNGYLVKWILWHYNTLGTLNRWKGNI